MRDPICSIAVQEELILAVEFEVSVVHEGDGYEGTVVAGCVDECADEVALVEGFPTEGAVLELVELLSFEIKIVDLVVHEWCIDMEAESCLTEVPIQTGSEGCSDYFVWLLDMHFGHIAGDNFLVEFGDEGARLLCTLTVHYRGWNRNGVGFLTLQ